MEKFIKIPNEAKTLSLGQKPKRGRPALAKKALQVQPKAIIFESPVVVPDPTDHRASITKHRS